MKCLNCDKEYIRNTQNYCTICGIPKDVALKLCKLCKSRISISEGEFCGNCGEYLLSGKTRVTEDK